MLAHTQPCREHAVVKCQRDKQQCFAAPQRAKRGGKHHYSNEQLVLSALRPPTAGRPLRLQGQHLHQERWGTWAMPEHFISFLQSPGSLSSLFGTASRQVLPVIDSCRKPVIWLKHDNHKYISYVSHWWEMPEFWLFQDLTVHLSYFLQCTYSTVF